MGERRTSSPRAGGRAQLSGRSSERSVRRGRRHSRSEPLLSSIRDTPPCVAFPPPSTSATLYPATVRRRKRERGSRTEREVRSEEGAPARWSPQTSSRRRSAKVVPRTLLGLPPAPRGRPWERGGYARERKSERTSGPWRGRQRARVSVSRCSACANGVAAPVGGGAVRDRARSAVQCGESWEGVVVHEREDAAHLTMANSARRPGRAVWRGWSSPSASDRE